MASDKTFLRLASPKGFSVEDGRSTGVPCPRPDCNEIVVYNGNYFCACGWAAPDFKLTEAQADYMELLHEGLKENDSRHR